MSSRPRLDLFLNIGHTLDHLVMLIFPTVVLAIGEAWQMSYGELLPLALGGLHRLRRVLDPGRLARRPLEPLRHDGGVLLRHRRGDAPHRLRADAAEIAARTHADRRLRARSTTRSASRCWWRAAATSGSTLGVNGVFGNIGLAFAALFAGALADLAGWRAAFIVPGLVCIGIGVGFVIASRGVERRPGHRARKRKRACRAPSSRACS